MELILWAWLLLSLGLVVVVPVTARAIVDGRLGAASAVLVAFVALSSFTPGARAAGNPPPGSTLMGAGNTTQACEPGAQLFYVYTGVHYINSDGLCPSGGSVLCGKQTLVNGQTPFWYGTGNCYQLVTTGDPGTGGGDTMTLLLPELSEADALIVCAALITVWGTAFGIRAVRAGLRSSSTE